MLLAAFLSTRVCGVDAEAEDWALLNVRVHLGNLPVCSVGASHVVFSLFSVSGVTSVLPLTFPFNLSLHGTSKRASKSRQVLTPQGRGCLSAFTFPQQAPPSAPKVH